MPHSEQVMKAFTDGLRKAGSMDNLCRLAQQGDAEIQYALAVTYLLDGNASAATPWLRKAAAQGHALARFSAERASYEGF